MVINLLPWMVSGLEWLVPLEPDVLGESYPPVSK